VLVIAVQNDADYKDLGAATSGATFFRSIGGSFGTATFGAIFANALTGNLSHYLAGIRLPPGFNAAAGASPAVLATLPPPVHTALVEAYAASIQTVFLVAVPIAFVAFLLSWLLKEVPLRGTTTVPDPAQALAPSAMPSGASSSGEVIRALSLLARRENGSPIYRALAEAAGVKLDPRSTWILFRLDGHPEVHLSALAGQLAMSTEQLASLFEPLAAQGLVTIQSENGAGSGSGRQLRLTPEGSAAIARLVMARRRLLGRHLGNWSDEMDERLSEDLLALGTDLLRNPSLRQAVLAWEP
jgi:DNA-binding MarR family transcriptional regulator